MPTPLSVSESRFFLDQVPSHIAEDNRGRGMAGSGFKGTQVALRHAASGVALPDRLMHVRCQLSAWMLSSYPRFHLT